MTHALRLSKLLIIAALGFPLVYACSSNLNGQHGAPQIIKIVSGNTTSGDLELIDKGGNPAKTFKTNPGATIRWLANAPEVDSILNIYAKPSSMNVFSDPPHREGTSQNWVGTIDSTALGKDEDYNIDWKDSMGEVHTFDPKIQVR